MKNVIWVTVILFTIHLSPLTGAAQVAFKSKSGIGSQIVEKSLMSGIVLLDHSYQLLDTVRHIGIGRDDNDSYGRSLSLAIATADSRLIVTEPFVEPWRFDTAYRPLDNCRPTPFEAKVRQSTDTNFDPFTYDTCAKFGVDGLYTVPYTSQGLVVDSLIGKKQGFYAVFTTTKPLAGHLKSNLNCTLIEKDLNIEWGQSIYPVEANLPRFNVVGGIYVVPSYQKPGMLTLQVAGIMQHIDGKWILLTFNH